ncbi:MAG: radical SAM protein [Bacteroidota bacterium]
MQSNRYPGLHWVRGWEFRWVQLAMLAQLWWIAFRRYGDIKTATRAFRKLISHGDQVLANQKLARGFRINGRYGWDMFHPLWPSPAFNQFFEQHYEELMPLGKKKWPLRRLLIALTKRCPLACAHCSEWDSLNQPDILSREELESKIQGMINRGISQLIYSGGEPLVRWKDLLYLLNRFHGQSQWIYSSGHGLTREKAQALKEAGLEGIAISLDHHEPAGHDTFRGSSRSFQWVEKSIQHAQSVGLLVSVNVCPTRNYLDEFGLEAFMELMHRWQVPIVNVLEPRAVGHYAGQEVELLARHKDYLAELFYRYNFSSTHQHYPILTYPGISRRYIPCGGGRSYLLLDYDGTLRPCPFCKTPLSLKEDARVARCEA